MAVVLKPEGRVIYLPSAKAYGNSEFPFFSHWRIAISCAAVAQIELKISAAKINEVNLSRGHSPSFTL